MGRKEPAREPLQWRITELGGRLQCVILEEAGPLRPEERLVWEGAAPHIAEAYRAARAAGNPVILTRDGFCLRRANPINEMP